MPNIDSPQFVWQVITVAFHTLIIFWPLWLILILLLALKVTLDHLADRTARWLWSFKFADKKNIRDLQSLTPSQFEQFTATMFEKLGYKTEVFGGPHDGGIDVSATKDGR